MMTHTNTQGSDLIASMLAGATAEFAVLPICTIQTIYQTQQNLHTKQKILMVDITKNLYKNKGVLGFYNASFSAISGQMVSTGSKYTLYRSIQTYRQTEQSNVFGNAINGIMSGVCSIIFTQPLDTMKNYQQRHHNYFSDVLKNPFIMYRGATQSVFKCALLGSLLYPTNDFFSSYITRFDPFINTLLASISTSIAISPIMHPVDLLKRRRMAGQKLWMGYNPIHYYQGFLINICRTIPHFAVTMITINNIKNLI